MATGETVDAIIRRVAAGLTNSASPLLDARLIVGAALQLNPAALIAAGVDVPDAEQIARIEAMAARRARGKPVAYITGEKEFWSLSLEMAPGVLIPRPDTETLVAAALARRSAVASILDLGCGSGALLCALLKEYPYATGLGLDLNPDAVALTRRNLARCELSARGRALEGDWTSPGFAQRLGAPFDLVVSNPPYIPDGERTSLPADVRDFEDHRALFAGEDGLAAYRAILASIGALVAPGGLMVLEIGDGQAGALCGLAAGAAPGAGIAAASDLAGRPRALMIDLAGKNNH
jgi:release factor glutamine methyltransferase